MRLHDKDRTGTIDLQVRSAGAARSPASRRRHPRAHQPPPPPCPLQEFEHLHSFLTNVSANFKYFAAGAPVLSKAKVRQGLEHAGIKLDGPAFETAFRSFDPENSQAMDAAQWISLQVFLQGASATFRAFDREVREPAGAGGGGRCSSPPWAGWVPHVLTPMPLDSRRREPAASRCLGTSGSTRPPRCYNGRLPASPIPRGALPLLLPLIDAPTLPLTRCSLLWYSF